MKKKTHNFNIGATERNGALIRKCGDGDNLIPGVSSLIADIFSSIFPYVRNSAEWQKRSV